MIKAYCIKNTCSLKVSDVHNQILQEILPTLVPQWMDSPGDKASNLNHLSKDCRISAKTQSCKGLKFLGLQYKAKRKTYYVHGHKRVDVVDY